MPYHSSDLVLIFAMTKPQLLLLSDLSPLQFCFYSDPVDTTDVLQLIIYARPDATKTYNTNPEE